MPNLLTRGGLTVALLALSAFAARPAFATEAAFVAARSFQAASAHQFGLAAMVVALVGFIGIAAAHWKALAQAIGYRPRPSRRRTGLRF